MKDDAAEVDWDVGVYFEAIESVSGVFDELIIFFEENVDEESECVAALAFGVVVGVWLDSDSCS